MEMKMSDYINDFTNHLVEAMEIGSSVNLNKKDKKFSNILICGLGGSGIGGTIVNDIISPKAVIPIAATKDYNIARKLNNSFAYYRILNKSRSSQRFKNIYWLWHINKRYNKLNTLKNIFSIFCISINSIKKYGIK